MRTTTVRALVAVTVIAVLALVSFNVPESFSQSDQARYVPGERAGELSLSRQALEQEIARNPEEALNYIFSVMPGPIGEPPDTLIQR